MLGGVVTIVIGLRLGLRCGGRNKSLFRAVVSAVVGLRRGDRSRRCRSWVSLVGVGLLVVVVAVVVAVIQR